MAEDLEINQETEPYHASNKTKQKEKKKTLIGNRPVFKGHGKNTHWVLSNWLCFKASNPQLVREGCG